MLCYTYNTERCKSFQQNVRRIQNCVLLILEPESSFIGLSIAEKLCFKEIANLISGLSHAFARTSDKEIYCRGYNKFGQLGNGSQNDSYCEPEFERILEP